VQIDHHINGITSAANAADPHANAIANARHTAPATGTEQAAAPAKEQSRPADLERAAQTLRQVAENLNTSLKFETDSTTGKTIVKVVDNVTQEVIRQFPSEEMLAVARALDENKGLLFGKKV